MTRKLFLILSLFCTSVFAQAFLTLEYLSYEDAVILSKEQDKKLFLIFSSDDCVWCEKQKQTLMEQKVLYELQNYIICFVDKNQRLDLSEKYKIKSIPAYFVIKDDKTLKKAIGYKNQDDFLVWLGKK